jgi:hypothetical protein
MPLWIVIISWISLTIAFASAIVIALDLLRRPQHMWIMNLVWPITALYAGPIAVWAYFKFGILSSHHHMIHGEKPHKPAWITYAQATTHCGSGCALGDIIAEWSIWLFPAILTWFGYGTLWKEKMFSGWIIDYIPAFVFGIAFQYFTIIPMKNLPPGKGLIAALKADSLSLTAWQVGMYGWMAIAMFLIFRREIPTTSPVFWFMMQIAMLVGFITSYPVNVWLVKTGIKEKM